LRLAHSFPLDQEQSPTPQRLLGWAAQAAKVWCFHVRSIPASQSLSEN
jgi:hypothetical protein